VLEREKN